MLKLFYSKSGDNELNEQELALLVVLNGLQCDKHEYLFTSMTEISYTMTGRWLDFRNKDRRLYENIRTGIQSLADRGIIKIIDQNGDNYVISNDGLKVDTDKDNFIVVELWEMQRIFSQANKPFGVFTFFICINSFTVDHIIPRSMGGADAMDNLQCTCRNCNLQKASYLPETFFDRISEIFIYQMDKKYGCEGEFSYEWKIARNLIMSLL